MKQENLKLISARVPHEIHDQLKSISKEEGYKLQFLFAKALEQFIDNKEKGSK